MLSYLSLPHDLLEEAEQDVVVDRPLMRFIEHHHAVGRQQRVQHHLSQQHSVRAELDFGRRTDPANDTQDGTATLSWCRYAWYTHRSDGGFEHVIFSSSNLLTRSPVFFSTRMCVVQFFSSEAVVLNFRDGIALRFEINMQEGLWDSHTAKLGKKNVANTNRPMALSLEHLGEYKHQDRGLTKRYANSGTLSRNEQSIPLFPLSATPSPLPRELPR